MLLSHILSIVNSDWLQHTRSIRGMNIQHIYDLRLSLHSVVYVVQWLVFFSLVLTVLELGRYLKQLLHWVPWLGLLLLLEGENIKHQLKIIQNEVTPPSLMKVYCPYFACIWVSIVSLSSSTQPAYPTQHFLSFRISWLAVEVPLSNYACHKRSFVPSSAHIWNALPESIPASQRQSIAAVNALICFWHKKKIVELFQ